MTDETPRSEGEPSPPAPDEAPTAENKPFTYDDAVQQAGDEDDVTPPAAESPAPPPAPAPDADVTQATPTATAAAPASAPAAVPVATVPTDRPNGIFIPKWVGILAAAVIAALVFGGIGYAIGDSSSDSGNTQNASSFPGFNGNGQVPNGNGNGQFPNGNGNGNGNGQTNTNAGFLGVGVGTADNGVEVTEVASGSPAANAGLEQGDVITAIDGTKVTTPLALRNAIQQHSSGDTITVTYTRDGKSDSVKVTLTSRSAQSS